MESEPELSEYDESDQDNSSDGATPRPQDESTLVEIQDESMDSDVAANVEVTTGTLPASHWNEIVARNIKEYLVSGKYPSDLPSSESVKRRNFRKRAKDFIVKNDRLYYVDKKNGSLRLAIHSKEEQERAFQVCCLVSNYVKCTGHSECLLIQECHSNPSGGHLGRSKTVGKIKTRHYWPNQYVDVDHLVSGVNA